MLMFFEILENTITESFFWFKNCHKFLAQKSSSVFGMKWFRDKRTAILQCLKADQLD